ncbi:hypothetical protein D3C80_1147880 [compost metagenome]
MGFRSALDLVDFGECLVTHPRFGPRGIDRTATIVNVYRKHQAVAEIGIVGNRQHLIALVALFVHPRPQVLRFGRIEC